MESTLEFSHMTMKLPKFLGNRSLLTPSAQRRVEWYESNTKMGSLLAHPIIIFGPTRDGGGPIPLRLICICLWCKSMYIAEHNNYTYCTISHAARHREHVGIARAKANAKRFPHPKNQAKHMCLQCGKEVIGRKFCDNSCAGKWNYAQMPAYVGIKGTVGKTRRFTDKARAAAQRRSQLLKGKPLSHTTRQRLSVSQKRRWDERKAGGYYPIYLMPAVRQLLLRKRTPAHVQLIAALQLPEEATEVPLQLNGKGIFVDIVIDKLIIEVDGATHAHKAQRQMDKQRDTALQALGYSVLRVWNWEIEEDIAQVLTRIHMSMTSK